MPEPMEIGNKMRKEKKTFHIALKKNLRFFLYFLFPKFFLLRTCLLRFPHWNSLKIITLNNFFPESSFLTDSAKTQQG